MEDTDEDEDGNELRRRKPGDKYRKEVEKEVERIKVKVPSSVFSSHIHCIGSSW